MTLHEFILQNNFQFPAPPPAMQRIQPAAGASNEQLWSHQAPPVGRRDSSQ